MRQASFSGLWIFQKSCQICLYSNRLVAIVALKAFWKVVMRAGIGAIYQKHIDAGVFWTDGRRQPVLVLCNGEF